MEVQQDATLDLWSYHSEGFSLTAGFIDHEKSYYHQEVAGVPDAYAELSQRLGTNQIIWCYKRNDQFIVTSIVYVEWSLCVPVRSILAFVDNEVWERILGTKAIPTKLFQKWLCDSANLYDDESAAEQYIEERKREYLSRPEPEGGWWRKLVVPYSTGSDVSALLRHPVPDEWVKSRRKVGNSLSQLKGSPSHEYSRIE